MEQKNERKVISRKQMATKLLDSFFGWGILFGIAVGLVRGAIDIPLTKFLKGNVYDIVTAIIILIGYAIQWMFTARIAVKNTFKKYTINKDQSKGILNKTIVFFSVLNIVVAGLGIYSIIAANNKLAFGGASVDITLPIILQAIVGVGAVGIIIYMANTQKSYIETQCVENMPEEKLKKSVAEIVLLVIIGVILVVAIGWAIKVGVIDRQAMENDEYDYGFLEDNEGVNYNDIEDLDKAQQELIKDAEEAAKKSTIAEAKSLVALVYAENLFKDEMVDGEFVKSTPEELEKLINDKLLTEFGPEYTVKLSEDYGVTYNFETEVKEESKEEAKVEYKNIVSTLLKKHETKTGDAPCEDDVTEEININIPKINIDTDNVAKVNKQIREKAEDELEALKSETIHGDISFSYEYSYVENKGVLVVAITEEFSALCKSGSIKYTSYIYDINKDKFLTNEEALKLYNINEKLLKEKAYDYIEKTYSGDEEYKSIVKDIINNKEYVVSYIEEDQISVYYDIPYDGFSVIY